MAQEEKSFLQFFLACAGGDEDEVKQCIQKLKVPVNVKNSVGMNAAGHALVAGQRHIAIYLLKCGLVTPEDADAEGYTLLHAAARHGDLEFLNVLVEQYKVNLNPTTCVEQRSETPLHRAASHGQFQAVKYLIESGAKVDQLSGDGRTILHCAARVNEWALVEYLLDLNNPETGKNYFAVDERNERFASTPLTCAARNNGTATVQRLLIRGADPEIFDNEQLNALLASVYSRAWSSAGLLIGCGASTSARFADGRTAEELLLENPDGSRMLRQGSRAFKKRKEELVILLCSDIPEFQTFQTELFQIVFSYCPSLCSTMLLVENPSLQRQPTAEIVSSPVQKKSYCIIN